LVQETLALTRRFIQLQRRPSTLIAGIIQPVMWLVLFGALFQNAPQGLFGNSQSYGQFLGAGVIVLLPLLERLMLVCRCLTGNLAESLAGGSAGIRFSIV